MSTLIRGVRVLTLDTEHASAGTLVAERRIQANGPGLNAGGAAVIEAGGLLAMPGLVRLQTLLGAVEMLQGGVTAVRDDAFHNPAPPRPDPPRPDPLRHRRHDGALRRGRHPRDRHDRPSGRRGACQIPPPRRPARFRTTPSATSG